MKKIRLVGFLTVFLFVLSIPCSVFSVGTSYKEGEFVIKGARVVVSEEGVLIKVDFQDPLMLDNIPSDDSVVKIKYVSLVVDEQKGKKNIIFAVYKRRYIIFGEKIQMFQDNLEKAVFYLLNEETKAKWEELINTAKEDYRYPLPLPLF